MKFTFLDRKKELVISASTSYATDNIGGNTI